MATAGRKPLAAQAGEVIDLDTGKVEGAMQALRAEGEAQQEHETRVRSVALAMGYMLPADATDPDLIQRDIAANMRRSVEACLEVGRGLAVLKAACAHGEFQARLDVLNIDPHVSARFMQAAAKFSKLPTSATLKAIGNQSKLFEMLVLDDEQIAELELTGQTGELALDDIATMSVKELRKALREQREDTEAVHAVLSKKNARIDELETKVQRIKRVPKDEAAAETLKEFAGVAADAKGLLLGTFRAGVEAVLALDGDHALTVAAAIGGLTAELEMLRDRHGLPIVSADQVPAWAQGDGTAEGAEG